MRLHDASSAWTAAVPCVGTASTPAAGPTFPENAHAVIYRLARSMVSAAGGMRRSGGWRSGGERGYSTNHSWDGWVASIRWHMCACCQQPFPNQQAAIACAERQGLRYEVR